MTREQFISQVNATREPFRRFLVALCCGDTQLADDIAQEAYIKSYLAIEAIRDDAKFKAWLFRIGYNTFISNCRREHPSMDLDGLMDNASENRSDEGFRYEQLYKSLDLLPPKERTSLLLFYMEGYSVKEIADILDVSLNSAKQYLSRGRFHLKESIGQ